jgi:hypothetical protein
VELAVFSSRFWLSFHALPRDPPGLLDLLGDGQLDHQSTQDEHDNKETPHESRREIERGKNKNASPKLTRENKRPVLGIRRLLFPKFCEQNDFFLPSFFRKNRNNNMESKNENESNNVARTEAISQTG